MNTATKKHPASHTASRVKAPCEGAGDNLVHGFATNQPGTNTVRDGIRSWQNVSDGSMRPFVNGWRSLRGDVLRSHSMQGSAVRSRASTWPLQRAMSFASVMSGSLRAAVIGCFGTSGHKAREAFTAVAGEQQTAESATPCDQRPVAAQGFHLGCLLGRLQVVAQVAQLQVAGVLDAARGELGQP